MRKFIFHIVKLLKERHGVESYFSAYVQLLEMFRLRKQSETFSCLVVSRQSFPRRQVASEPLDFFEVVHTSQKEPPAGL